MTAYWRDPMHLAVKKKIATSKEGIGTNTAMYIHTVHANGSLNEVICTNTCLGSQSYPLFASLHTTQPNRLAHSHVCGDAQQNEATERHLYAWLELDSHVSRHSQAIFAVVEAATNRTITFLFSVRGRVSEGNGITHLANCRRK